MKKTTVGSHVTDEVDLTRQWREANARVRELEVSERGRADTPELAALPDAMAAAAEAAVNDPVVRRSLGFLPYRWSLVELDRLVVWQNSVNLNFVDKIKRTLSLPLSDHDLIRACIGNLSTPPPIHITPLDGNTFAFSSPSNDLRVLSVAPFDPRKLCEQETHGYPSSVLGIFIGYGTNLVRAYYMHNRLVLLNGSHRACALRMLGVTHIPCLVQYASHEDDLDLVGVPEIRRHSERYFGAPRPPLFKDYFDDRVRKIVSVPRRNLMLQVQLTIQQSMVPAF
jgi:hypothetical protein